MNLDAVRRIALALPETTEQPHHEYTSFRVSGKIFVTAPPQGGHIHLFLPEEERETALALYPAFTEKLYWGKAAAGVRLALAEASESAVEHLVQQAWRNKAPKSLHS